MPTEGKPLSRPQLDQFYRTAGQEQVDADAMQTAPTRYQHRHRVSGATQEQLEEAVAGIGGGEVGCPGLAARLRAVPCSLLPVP